MIDDPRRVTIFALGRKGHGISYLNGQKLHLKNALPGEEWEINQNSSPKRLTDSPQRIVPPCTHFGLCGGCVAQHMQERFYVKWKHESIQNAFDGRGVKATIAPLRLVSKHSRRRAFLGVECRNENVVIGFREEACHSLVGISECIVLDPSIVGILEDLKAIAKIAMPKNTAGRVVITKVDNGLDVNFQNGLKQLRAEERAEIFRIAEKKSIVRLIVSHDTIFFRSEPHVTLGGIQIGVPSSVFLQAVEEAEKIMIDFVVNALPKKVRHVCDLFCGVGTFTFPVAKRVPVSAFDNNRTSIVALQQAAKKALGLKPIKAFVRDLFREPLSPKELSAFDVVVYDPPRIGAAHQTERLAKSNIPIIIAISCNPSSLARDAKILIDSGYKMGIVTAIDQFIYSSHLECMTVFTREFL